VTYAWDLDGNGTFETSGQTATLTPDDGPASLTVTVQATDPSGLSSTDTAAGATTSANSLLAWAHDRLASRPIT